MRTNEAAAAGMQPAVTEADYQLDPLYRSLNIPRRYEWAELIDYEGEPATNHNKQGHFRYRLQYADGHIATVEGTAEQFSTKLQTPKDEELEQVAREFAELKAAYQRGRDDHETNR